jgi:hypothetical protein
MCRFSFINVVCEILKLNCDLYKYMLYLSHGKAKEKKEKKEKRKGPSPSAWAPGTRGRVNLKKRKGPSPSAWAPGTRGRAN